MCYAILEALNDITLIRTFQATNQSAGEKRGSQSDVYLKVGEA